MVSTVIPASRLFDLLREFAASVAKGVVVREAVDLILQVGDRDLELRGEFLRGGHAARLGLELVAGTLDFTKVGQSSTKAVYAHDVDKAAPGGLKTVGDILSYPTAESYVRKTQ